MSAAVVVAFLAGAFVGAAVAAVALVLWAWRD